jgi:hypothetical protein
VRVLKIFVGLVLTVLVLVELGGKVKLHLVLESQVLLSGFLFELRASERHVMCGCELCGQMQWVGEKLFNIFLLHSVFCSDLLAEFAELLV